MRIILPLLLLAGCGSNEAEINRSVAKGEAEALVQYQRTHPDYKPSPSRRTHGDDVNFERHQAQRAEETQAVAKAACNLDANAC